MSSLASSASSSATLVASAALACFSVGLNLYGGLLTERKRADLQLELERERAAAAAAAELQSLLARYRGPLLESAVDLEQRLWHLACFPEEWELAPCAVAACDVTQVVGTGSGGNALGGNGNGNGIASGNGGGGVATSGTGVVVGVADAEQMLRALVKQRSVLSAANAEINRILREVGQVAWRH